MLCTFATSSLAWAAPEDGATHNSSAEVEHDEGMGDDADNLDGLEDDAVESAENAEGIEEAEEDYALEGAYVDEDGNIDFDANDESESDYYVPEGDGATGRTAGSIDSRLPERAAQRWEGNSPIRGAGRIAGASIARIAAGDEAMPGRNEIANVDFISSIPELIQWDSLIGGCEIVSMTSVLNAMGYDVAPQTLADEYISYDVVGEGDYVNYYIGSPYESGGGFPPVLAYAGNGFLEDSNSDWRFHNVSGASFSSLLSQVDYGLPVLVWTTMNMDEPLWTGFDYGGYEWYNNEHCVVLYGYNEEEGTVQVMDPMAGLIDRDLADFEYLYDECGQLALALSFG